MHKKPVLIPLVRQWIFHLFPSKKTHSKQTKTNKKWHISYDRCSEAEGTLRHIEIHLTCDERFIVVVVIIQLLLFLTIIVIIVVIIVAVVVIIAFVFGLHKLLNNWTDSLQWFQTPWPLCHITVIYWYLELSFDFFTLDRKYIAYNATFSRSTFCMCGNCC